MVKGITGASGIDHKVEVLGKCGNATEMKPTGITAVVGSECILRNCKNCEHLGADDDGGDPPSDHYNVCEKIEDKELDPNFPYFTEQPCHVPGFWAYMDHDEELKKMFDEDMEKSSNFDRTYARFKEKYIKQEVVPSVDPRHQVGPGD